MHQNFGRSVKSLSLHNQIHIVFVVSSVGPGAVSGVAFDFSGSYLAIGGGGEKGHSVQVHVVKDWSQLLVSLHAMVSSRFIICDLRLLTDFGLSTLQASDCCCLG